MRAGNPVSSRSRRSLVRLVLGISLVTMACGGDTYDDSRMKSLGSEGEKALALIAVHGGMDAYLALADLEYRVAVQRFDATGALAATYEEVHRFPVAPPRRYALRRTGQQVLELGQGADQRIWSRIDGMARGGELGEAAAFQDVWLRSVLSRAPFCLADEDVKLAIGPDGVTLTATWPAGPDGNERTAVFFTDAASGRLERVVLQDPGMILGALMQSAAVRSTTDYQGLSLVDGWSLSTTQVVDGQAGMPHLAWKIEQIRSDNGFTERLYELDTP